jgi:hypothetical protein
MRLIDADALYREYQEKVCYGIACHECKATNKDGTCKLDLFISTAPTIDAVEVVRCRECKFSEVYQNDSSGVCGRWCEAFAQRRVVSDDDFCSYGDQSMVGMMK